jgi:hypothetical protein
VLGDTPTVAPRVIDPAKIGPMTFDDDFKTFDHGVDQERPAKPHKWRTVYGINGPNDPANRMLVNNLEDQVFVDPAFGGLTGCPALGIDPFDFKPGQVDVKAERLSGVAKKCLGYGWSSGLLTTMFSFSQKWGYFEAELDVPTAKGFWPAFWLVPTEGPWPDGGEIDVLESVGPATPGGQAKASINTVWKSPEDGTRKENQAFTALITPGFHRYGVLWRPDTISFYFDRKLLRTSPTPPGYTKAMYMILSLSVGQSKSWPGAPDPSTERADMLVKRVSVWALKPDAAAALGQPAKLVGSKAEPWR